VHVVANVFSLLLLDSSRAATLGLHVGFQTLTPGTAFETDQSARADALENVESLVDLCSCVPEEAIFAHWRYLVRTGGILRTGGI
jgi:hypothetical protein